MVDVFVRSTQDARKTTRWVPCSLDFFLSFSGKMSVYPEHDLLIAITMVFNACNQERGVNFHASL